VVEDIRARVGDGVREVVLTGVHLGKYGQDEGRADGLAALVERILVEVPTLERLRLSSVLPVQVTERLVDLMASTDRICNHLHVPLQSGSDRVLADMERSYDVGVFLERVGYAQSRVPALGLSTDVIVGFPTETDDDFRRTLEVVETVGFSKLHVFRYSPRPGTASAERWRDSVRSQDKKARSKELIDLGNRLRDRFHAGLIGTELSVLVEAVRDDGWLSGTADNYVKVSMRGASSLFEQRRRARLTGLRGAAMTGELVS
jgi:threonylcarbamoyladenosine tRNA methylthiotransferase MtaB